MQSTGSVFSHAVLYTVVELKASCIISMFVWRVVSIFIKCKRLLCSPRPCFLRENAVVVQEGHRKNPCCCRCCAYEITSVFECVFKWSRKSCESDAVNVDDDASDAEQIGQVNVF